MTHLCRRLPRAEFDARVVALTRGGPMEAPLAEAGIPVVILGKKRRWDFSALNRLTRLIRELKPGIVHTWLSTANTIGRIAAIRAGAPAIIASERAADIWKGPLRRLIDRRLERRTSLILTNAQAIKRHLVESIGLAAEKIRVIRNGLDPAEFDMAAAAEPNAPLPESAGPLIGAVGRLEEQKGMRFLLDAFAMLAPESRAELWLVGAGPEESALRRQADALGIAKRTHFLGARQDAPAVMARFDIFALASLWEGLPNAALEAMACRKPVVATDVNGVPEAVAHGETGLLVPARNPTALADALAKLLADPEMRRRYGEAGRRRVESEFGMQRMVDETAAAYRGVAALK